MTYYFDVLPLHPQPEYLESLTSYLMRLAELNGISSIDGISALCFPYQDRRITREIADYPPISFGQLITAGLCSEEMLRATTFFHLAAKFGRSTLPQPVSRFLSRCVSQYLRYCPVCVTEQQVPYYLLSWRFLTLTCCWKHKCRLLDICKHCSQTVPLFAAPFKLGNCPRCLRGLALCTTSLVTDEAELQTAACVQNEIVFLLTPQLWEANSTSIIKLVGRQLARTRQAKRLTVVEIANQIGVTPTVIEGMERGNFQNKGATFQSYLKYVNYLSLGLKEIFSDAINPSDHIPATSLPLRPTCQQNYCVTRYGHNRSGTQRYLCHYCYRSFTALPKAREAKRRSSDFNSSAT